MEIYKTNLGKLIHGDCNRQDENYQRPKFVCSIDKGLHPTQKSLKLMEELVKIHSNEGQTILDCFSGSMTTAIACENLNRRYICIEKDDNYFQIGKERVIKHIEEKNKKGENNVEINAGAV